MGGQGQEAFLPETTARRWYRWSPADEPNPRVSWPK